MYSYPFILDYFYCNLGVEKTAIAVEYAGTVLEESKENTVVSECSSGGEICGLAVYGLSDFDTKILGLKTAKVKTLILRDGKNVPQAHQLLDKLAVSFKDNGVEFASYRFSSLDIELAQRLAEFGFVKVDDYVILSRPVSEPLVQIEYPQEIVIRVAENRDVPELQANHAHTFTYSRFFNDPALNSKVATEMHRQWIANSVAKKAADEVYVAVGGENIPVGFVTVQSVKKYESVFGHIPLIGVKQEYAGRKIGRLLINKAFEWFKTKEIKHALIETQGANLKAINSYQNSGFSELGRGVTYSWSSKTLAK